MIWILVGLIMTSLVVGAIVTALTTVNNEVGVKIYGTEVRFFALHFTIV